MGWTVAGLWLVWAAAAFLCAALFARLLTSVPIPTDYAWKCLRALLVFSGPVNAFVGGGLLATAAYFIAQSYHQDTRLLLAGLALGIGAAPPQALIAVAVRGAYAEIRGRDPGAFELMRQLLPRAALISVPLGTTFMVVAAGRKLAAAGAVPAEGYASAVVLGLVVALWVLQWPALQQFTLPGKVIPFGMRGWADEAVALSIRMGVRLRKLLLVQTARTRIAGAFALSGERIAYTDYLISALNPDEFLAITAHELQHFKQRPRMHRAAVTCIACAGALGFAAAGLAARGTIPMGTAVAASALAALPIFAVLARMKRRNEDEADDAAIVEVGARPLMSALAKTYALNGRFNERGRASHRALSERLARIRTQAGLPEDAEFEALDAALDLLHVPAQVS